MTDRELIELAAKAAGITGFRYVNNEPIQGAYRTGVWSDLYEDCWNPLEDDGDALRLAVKLNIVIWECAQYNRALSEVRYGKATGEYWELVGDDPYAATRRAITRAAAEIGKGMK